MLHLRLHLLHILHHLLVLHGHGDALASGSHFERHVAHTCRHGGIFARQREGVLQPAAVHVGSLEGFVALWLLLRGIGRRVLLHRALLRLVHRLHGLAYRKRGHGAFRLLRRVLLRRLGGSVLQRARSGRGLTIADGRPLGLGGRFRDSGFGRLLLLGSSVGENGF